VHHVQHRSMGGTNSPSNLVTMCEQCHTKSHKSGFKHSAYNHTDNFRPSGILNAVIPKLLAAIQVPVKRFYGYQTKVQRRTMGLPKSHSNDAVALASFGISNREWLAFEIDLQWQQFRRHNRAATQRSEDRKYYVGNKVVAHNRAKRTGQIQPSLREFRSTLAGQWRQVVAKPAATIAAPRTHSKPFCPGDTTTTGNVVRGYSSTQRRVFFAYKAFAKIKDTSLWKFNSGLVLLRGAR